MSWDTKKCALVVGIDLRPEHMRVSEVECAAYNKEHPDLEKLIACDGVAIVPFWEETPDNPRTQQARTWGQDGKPLPSAALFQVWSMLTTDLASRGDLHPALRSMCKMVHELLDKAMSKVGPSPEAAASPGSESGG